MQTLSFGKSENEVLRNFILVLVLHFGSRGISYPLKFAPRF
jgi:hypothetical protein